MPDSLTAAEGDIIRETEHTLLRIYSLLTFCIEFQLFPPYHSVGRAKYQQPCIPYEHPGGKKVGFWSGFCPLSTVLETPPTSNLTINETEPNFLYCAAPGSCIDHQMVGVINSNSSVSLDNQNQEASSSQFMLAPGQPFLSEEGFPLGDVDPVANFNVVFRRSSSICNSRSILP